MNVIIIYSYDDPQYPLTDDVIKSLRDQKVEFDTNWILLTFFPPEMCGPWSQTKLIEVAPETWAWKEVITIKPSDYYVTNMIEKSHKTKWYQDIEFYGSKWIVALQHR